MKLTDLRRKQLTKYMESNNLTTLVIKHKSTLKTDMKRHTVFQQTAALTNGVLVITNKSGLRSNYTNINDEFDWKLLSDIIPDGYINKQQLVKC